MGSGHETRYRKIIQQSWQRDSIFIFGKGVVPFPTPPAPERLTDQDVWPLGCSSLSESRCFTRFEGCFDRVLSFGPESGKSHARRECSLQEGKTLAIHLISRRWFSMPGLIRTIRERGGESLLNRSRTLDSPERPSVSPFRLPEQSTGSGRGEGRISQWFGLPPVSDKESQYNNPTSIVKDLTAKNRFMPPLSSPSVPSK